jgi:hypothetical protein
MLKVKVKTVAPIKGEAQIQEFKKKYLSNDYLHEGDKDFKDRLDNTIDIQYKRWDWMVSHPDIYVNMLRLSGHSDENIQACLDGRKPICFTNEDIYSEFTLDLKHLKKRLEKESEFKNIRFIQAGSAVAGFSNNPLKGFRDIPSKITDPNKSDVDVVIVAYGVKAFVDKLRAQQAKLREYPSTSARKAPSTFRIGLRDWSNIPAVAEWMEIWKKKLGGGVQITLQEGDPITPPWEPYISLPN